MQQRATYLFAGGGTGGHLFPGIAVAEEILSRDAQAEIVFAGSEREIERQIVVEHGFEHCELPVEPSTTLRRNPLRFLWRNYRALRTATKLLRRQRPAAVIGLGGFASVPVVVAASRLRIPCLLLEQNSVPGRATHWLSRRASRICLSFDQSATTLPRTAATCVTGNPVRRQIAELHSKSESQFSKPQPTLLILGGSQGALAVNELALRSIETLSEALAGWRIVHQTGQQQFGLVQRRYNEWDVDSVVSPFFSNLVDWYRQATVVISRAGATTLAELACAGCPAILVPYPNAVADHQVCNARVFCSTGAARIVEQNGNLEATGQALARELGPLLDDGGLRDTMRQSMWGMAKPRAAGDVVDRLLELTAIGNR